MPVPQTHDTDTPDPNALAGSSNSLGAESKIGGRPTPATTSSKPWTRKARRFPAPIRSRATSSVARRAYTGPRTPDQGSITMDRKLTWHQRLNQARGWIFFLAIACAGLLWLIRR